MASYFSLPSFARAKKNQEDLQKRNPQRPVLKEADEQFLKRQIEAKEAPTDRKDAQPTAVTDDGKTREASRAEADQAGVSADQVAIPEKTTDATDETNPAGTQSAEQTQADDPATSNFEGVAKNDFAGDESAEDPPEQSPDEGMVTAATAEKPKKAKRNKSFELPSQEEAEAATRGFDMSDPPGSGNEQGGDGEKRTWASYLPKLRSTGQKGGESKAKTSAEKSGSAAANDGQQQRTWAEYASSAYQSLPSMPSLPSFSKDADSKPEPVYNEDGTINEEATKEKQEREVSVLLDRLNLSSINNRVFAFSGETEKIYERFSQVLKDTMNGAPTAYEDMDKLMKDAGPQLEKQFQSMPPFVQTLVKSLPAKLGTTLGPELMAAASEKPGADMKARMEAAEKADPKTSGESSAQQAQKKKQKIPGLKSLVSKQGTVASILRNVVNFLQTRFPFLASTTNVVMSLAVFSMCISQPGRRATTANHNRSPDVCLLVLS